MATRDFDPRDYTYSDIYGWVPRDYIDILYGGRGHYGDRRGTYADPMTDAYREYRRLDDELCVAIDAGLGEEEEERIIERMTDLWWEMTEEECEDERARVQSRGGYQR